MDNHCQSRQHPPIFQLFKEQPAAVEVVVPIPGASHAFHQYGPRAKAARVTIEFKLQTL
jgi:hypothetical protein